MWRSGDKEAESEVRVAIIAVDGGLMQLFVFICICESFKDPNESTCLLRYPPLKFIIHSGGISLAHSETSHVATFFIYAPAKINSPIICTAFAFCSSFHKSGNSSARSTRCSAQLHQRPVNPTLPLYLISRLSRAS